jgi:2-polyprenyl-6-methoxyphenol hydroxylase-like FAD-dependent oxidoreductase
MSPSHPFKTAIIGAGPVSLTLANILQNNNVPFTIYEAAETFRTTGGSLDLHPESGQLALREAGLWDAFVKHSRPEGDCDKIVNVDGEVLWDENLLQRETEKTEEEKFAGRPEIDRKALLNMLFANIKSDSIIFDRKLERVVPSSTTEAKYDLELADGSKETDIDLVIGADGAWSRVRSLIIDAKPQYSGISVAELHCFDLEANQWLSKYVGAGSMFSFSEGRVIIAQRQGEGILRTYAALRVPEDFLKTCGINWEDKNTAREDLVKQCFNDIGADLKRVVLDCKDDLTARALYELPVGLTWPHRAGVTLIGDAAHVMTPFAGVGVNVGMTDALVLGREIIAAAKGEKGLAEATRDYEKEMFPRAEMFAKKTAKGKLNAFSKDGSKNFADMMRAHHQPAWAS